MGKLKETDLAMMINNKTYIDYLNRLRLIATSLFTWDKLDDYAGKGNMLQLAYEYKALCRRL